MTIELCQPTHLTDDQLLLEVKTLAGRERVATAQLIASLAELDARRLYLGAGYSSLFTYCTECLHLSEHAAYGRIEAARVARRLPRVLDLIAGGSITLTSLCLLAPHLTTENHQQLLEAARHRSKREVERLVAALRPLPALPSTVRKLPEPRPTTARRLTPAGPASLPETSVSTATAASGPPASASSPSERRAIVAPLAPERYKVQFTITRETHDKLRRVQDLLRHSVQNGDPAVIFDRALTLLLTELERKKLAQTDRPRSISEAATKSRHVPAHVKRDVWKRDGGQCAFVGTAGRCAERSLLEFHHVVPFSVGGPTTSANLQLRCRAHNVYEAEEYFGAGEMFLLREYTPVYSTRSGPTLYDRATGGHAPPSASPRRQAEHTRLRLSVYRTQGAATPQHASGRVGGPVLRRAPSEVSLCSRAASRRWVVVRRRGSRKLCNTRSSPSKVSSRGPRVF